jgi:hypothetical protein
MRESIPEVLKKEKKRLMGNTHVYSFSKITITTKTKNEHVRGTSTLHKSLNRKCVIEPLLEFGYIF